MATEITEYSEKIKISSIIPTHLFLSDLCALGGFFFLFPRFSFSSSSVFSVANFLIKGY